jgi:predicted dehydrogenase
MLKIRRRITKHISHKLRWGVAGCGKFSESSFIPTLGMIRKAKLNSVFSHNLTRAKSIAQKFSASKFFNNYDEFLQSDIDAVYIGSSNVDHYEQVIDAAKAGKHILCDKPMSVTAKQAEEMLKTCKENNVFLSVNFVYRFNPIIRKTKELIEKQMIGKLQTIKLSFSINLFPGDNFRYNKELSGGGAIRDLGTHMIDLLRYLGGEIVYIDGIMDNILYKTEVEDFAQGLVKFSRSGYGTFQVSFCSPKTFNRIEILGTKGAINIDNVIGARFPSSGKLTILIDGETKKVFRKRANNLYRLLRSVNKNFLKNEEPEITGLDGFINMQLMEEFEKRCSTKKN